MNSKLVLVVVVLAACVSGLSAKDLSRARRAASTNAEPWWSKGTRFAYDCSGKADGNYPHPTKCTHFVACVAQEYAYEMVCATNDDGKPLHYVQDSGPNEQESYCDYPEKAGCAGPTPEPDPEPETTAAPAPDACNPDECQLEGDCQSYRQCVSTGQPGQGNWVSHNCSEAGDLWWNPERNEIHGGVCDFFGNLSPTVQAKYEADEDCINKCDWLQADEDKCSPNYTYREKFDGVTNAGRETRLSCPASSSGEQLYWNQATRTCDRCANVSGDNGACPCAQ